MECAIINSKKKQDSKHYNFHSTKVSYWLLVTTPLVSSMKKKGVVDLMLDSLLIIDMVDPLARTEQVQT